MAATVPNAQIAYMDCTVHRDICQKAEVRPHITVH